MPARLRPAFLHRLVKRLRVAAQYACHLKKDVGLIEVTKEEQRSHSFGGGTFRIAPGAVVSTRPMITIDLRYVPVVTTVTLHRTCCVITPQQRATRERAESKASGGYR